MAGGRAAITAAIEVVMEAIDTQSEVAVARAARHLHHAAALIGREMAKLGSGPLLGGVEVEGELPRRV
jgi:hypothetical protein